MPCFAVTRQALANCDPFRTNARKSAQLAAQWSLRTDVAARWRASVVGDRVFYVGRRWFARTG
eukprot:5381013-Alexandrium_andersonii.AAC.1